jgi:hypothetical protein
MADRNSITLNPPDLQNLADRLLSRGISKLPTDTTEQSRDLRVASRVIRRSIHELDAAADSTADLSKRLRLLSVSVES